MSFEASYHVKAWVYVLSKIGLIRLLEEVFMNFGDNNGYSSWEHTDYASSRGLKMYCDPKKRKEKVSSFPYYFESPYDGHKWVNRLISEQQEYNQKFDELDMLYQEALGDERYEDADTLCEEISSLNSEYSEEVTSRDFILEYKGVFRSDISHYLDLFIIGRGSEYHFLYKEDYDKFCGEFQVAYQGGRDWDDYHDNSDYSTRKLETHKYMVCGFALEDNKLSFIVSAPGGLISIAPAELRLLVIFNAVGGLCIHGGSIGLTSGMRRLHHYRGKGIGKFTRTGQTLYLPLHQYSKSGKKWYMDKWFAKDDDFPSVIGSVAVAADLVSAGFLVEDDNGNKLSKAALSRVALGIK